jgi:hypothetical protein
VSGVLNRRSIERTLFDSVEDISTSDVSAENDDLKSEFLHLPDADVPRIHISDFDFSIGFSDVSTIDQIRPAHKSNDHELVEELHTKGNVFSTPLTKDVTERKLPVSRRRLIFGMNQPERTDSAVDQQLSTHIRYNHDTESLGEKIMSQSLQRENNVVEDLFGYRTKDSSEDKESVERHEIVSGKSLQNAKATLRKWLESGNMDLIQERDASSMSDKDWRRRYDYQDTDNLSSYYKGDVIGRISDQQWFPDTPDEGDVIRRISDQQWFPDTPDEGDVIRRISDQQWFPDTPDEGDVIRRISDQQWFPDTPDEGDVIRRISDQQWFPDTPDEGDVIRRISDQQWFPDTPDEGDVIRRISDQQWFPDTPDEGDVIRRISDQQWFPDNLDKSLDSGHENADLKFACVTDELWSSFIATGRTEYDNCEFTCDCEAVLEEKSRWKRFIIRVPECRKGRKRIRKTCRKVWGKGRTAGAHPTS